MTSELVSVAQAAGLLDISVQAVYKLIRRGVLVPVAIDGLPATMPTLLRLAAIEARRTSQASPPVRRRCACGRYRPQREAAAVCPRCGQQP